MGKFFTKEIKHLDALIVSWRRIQYFVWNASMQVTIMDINMSKLKYVVDVVIVVMIKNGSNKIFALIICP